MSLCREGPKVSHLFFTGDSLLFCRANDKDCQTVLDILASYEQASGQQINHGKTQLFFSTNIDHNSRNRISDLYGVLAACQYEKYLGLPSFVRCGKKRSFSYIRETIWHKSKGGNKNFCPKWVEKYSSKMFSKQCQPSPWGASNSLKAFVKILNL